MGLTRPTAAQINTVITTISDPITVLNKGSTAANIDVGFIINRNGGALANTAIFWNEGANTFVTAFTTSNGATDANIAISTYANLRVNGLVANSVRVDNFAINDTLTIGSQLIYAQGTNGFSVNENYDPSANSLQTAYHFTSGAGREEVAFTLARTGEFTDGFGIYGTAADNTFVNFGEQSNTKWEWRSGIGIQPLNLDGGTLRMRLYSSGNLAVSGNINAGNVSATNFIGSGALLTGLPASYSNVNVIAYSIPINRPLIQATMSGTPAEP